MSKFQPKKTNSVFEQDAPDTSLTAVDAKLYGKVDAVPNSGRVSIKPVDIMTIWADLTQPRKAVPLAVRGNWNGNPKQVMDVLTKWWQASERTLDMKIDVPGILQGREQGEDGLVIPEGKATAEAFIELLRLGASIHAEGLTNAITIAPRGERFLIETGERRWLAHHLLNEFVDGKFNKVLAREVTYDRFRQASENNNRRKLTAIEMARQLALLLMDMYEGDKDVHFDAIEALTFNGCDRRFYAQVAHGRVWQIKKGFAERVQAAMGLPSIDRVADYRKLLRPTDDEELNDKIWMQADEENWTERYIRTYVDELKNPKNDGPESNVPTGDTWTGVHVSGDTAGDSDSQNGDENGSNPDQSAWASTAWVGQLVFAGPIPCRVVRATAPDKVIVVTSDNAEHEVNISTLRYRQTETTTSSKDNANWTSRAVQTVTGAVALVITDGNGYVQLRYPDDTTAQMEKKFTSLVPMTEWFQAVARYNAAKKAGNPTTGTTSTGAAAPAGIPGRDLTVQQIVGKPVLWNGKDAFAKSSDGMNSEGILIKVDGGERIIHKDSLILKGVSKDPIGTQEQDSDDAADADNNEAVAFKPFSVAFREAMQRLTEAAVLLGISEAVLIDDLCKLEREEVERIVHAEGVEATERILEAYRLGIKDAMEKITGRIETYLDDIRSVALEIAESK